MRLHVPIPARTADPAAAGGSGDGGRHADGRLVLACDAIAAAYRFYTAGWQRSPSGTADEALRAGLGTLALTALRDRAGIEGGIWQAGAGSLAYAFPTYQGAEPKTDVPQAELPRIQAVNLRGPQLPAADGGVRDPL